MTTFGRDTSCANSLRSGRFVTGVRLVAESYYRRLTTPRGLLRGGEEEANYGLDLTALVGQPVSASEAAALPGRVEAELLKDERTLSVTVSILPEKTDDGVGVRWLVTVDADTTEGPFTMQMGVTDVTAELIGIQEG